MWGFEAAVMLAMIGVNSLFAGYEIALASITLARLQRLADERHVGALAALHMKQNMEASLAVVQLGITLVGAIAAAVGGAGAEEYLTPAIMSQLGIRESAAELLALTLVVIPLTVVTIIFGELIPKVFALRNVEWICLSVSPFMRWFSFSVWPAVWLFESIVMGVMSWGERRFGGGDARPATVELQELRTSAALARASRLIGRREEGIILGATEIPSRTVREIMLPLEHISMLDAGASLSDNLIAAHLDMHTRFPVAATKGDPQSIFGYVNVKDMIAILRHAPQAPSLRSIVRAIPSFRADRPVAECLERLMREHTHIALVRDDAGAIVGMVSLEDILEELVGEIEDEYDRLPSYVMATGGAWVAGGGVGLKALQAAAGIDLQSGGQQDGGGERAGERTLSDWVLARLGREARGGDVVEHEGVSVTVRKVRRKKVQEALVRRHDGAAVASSVDRQ